jgi:hypothetical protein
MIHGHLKPHPNFHHLDGCDPRRPDNAMMLIAVSLSARPIPSSTISSAAACIRLRDRLFQLQSRFINC